MSLIETRMQNLRVNSPIDKNMARPSRYGALDLFVYETYNPQGIISPELRERAFASIGRTVQIPVLDYDGDVTLSNTRSCTIADDENTSKLYTVTFATVSWGFTMVPAMYHNNDISLQKDWERKFLKYLFKVAATLDTAALAALSAAKTQVFADTLNYTPTGNVISAGWDARYDILGDLEAMMNANDYYKRMHVVGNTGVQALINKLAKLGEQNAINERLEYLNKWMHFTNQLPNEEGVYGTMYMVEDGQVGMVFRVDRESLYRRRMADGTQWDVMELPLVGIPVGTYYAESKGDYSAIAGESTADMTCAFKEMYGFSFDYAIITPYNSSPTTVANPIIKATIGKPTGDPNSIPVHQTEPAPTAAGGGDGA